MAIGLRHVVHGQMAGCKRNVDVLVVGIALQNIIIVLQRLAVVLLVHIALGQDGVVARLGRHGGRQLLQLLARPVGLLYGVPQLLFLQRHGFCHPKPLLNAVQHLNAARHIARKQIGV